MPEAAFLGFTARTGEMSPGSIPKYLKRPLWRERKCEGCGRGAARPWDSGARASRTEPPPARPRRPHSSATPSEFIQPRPETERAPQPRPTRILLPPPCFAITPNKIYICIYDASLWKLEQNITLFSRDLIDIAATEPTTI